jgi:tryptophan synthase beta subunit
MKLAREMSREQLLIVNLSGRGDKDVNTVAESPESAASV